MTPIREDYFCSREQSGFGYAVGAAKVVIEGYEELDLFLSSSNPIFFGCIEYFGEGWWIVSEGITGMKIAPRGGTTNTKEEAIAAAKEFLDSQPKEGILQYVATIFESGKASPRYQEYPQETEEEGEDD